MLVVQKVSSVEIGCNGWIVVHLGSAPNPLHRPFGTLEVYPPSQRELCSTPTNAARREVGLFCALGRDDGRWTYPVGFCESSLISTHFTRLGEPEIR